MIKMFSIKRYVLTISAVLLLAFILASTNASAQAGWEDSMRGKMLLIAESYTAYQWKGHEWNIQHNNNHIHTPDAETDYTQHPLVDGRGNDISHVMARWWRVWNPAEGKNKINIGIPYFWNGSTAIQANDLNSDLNLGLVPIGGRYFDQLVESTEGLAAGDVTTEYDGSKQEFSAPEVGVDCVGFINNTWQIGVRAGTSATSGHTRAIQPEMLQSGDILMKYGSAYTNDISGNHVMLFKEFCGENDPACEPTPGLQVNTNPKLALMCNGYETDGDIVGRTFKVYESSAGYGRVTESVWRVVCVKDHPVDGGVGNYPTKKLGLERIRVRLDHEWVNENEERWQDAIDPVDRTYFVQSAYIPRSLFQPRDIVFVIDRSGSMGADGIWQAQQAADMFIDFMMRPGDRIGVVTFSSTAEQKYPLSGASLTAGEIISNRIDLGVKKDAKDAINSILSGGNTSIGSGLRKGQALLDTSTNKENRLQLMVLLSDGGENTSPFWEDLKNSQPREITVPVNVVGMGYDSPVLIDIATLTNGDWFGRTAGDWVNYKFQYMAVDTYREEIIKAAKTQQSASRVPLARGTSSRTSFAETVEERVLVDSTIGSVTFSLAWPLGELDLTLVQPDGTLIDPATAETDPNIEFGSGAAYEFYKIFAPQKGEWRVRVTGPSVSDYSMVASATGAMLVSVDTDKDKYSTGEEITITASIEDSFLDSPIAPEYIYGAIVQVTATNPHGAESSFALYDDGLHGDGDAEDGIYANIFSDTAVGGSYNFDVHIEGNTNRDGQLFVREKSFSVGVNAPPSVINSIRASANPTDDYLVDYLVSFSEPVTGVDVTDFVLTTQGVSGAGIKEVYGRRSDYTVTVITGSGNGTIRLDLIDDDTIVSTDNRLLGGVGNGNGNFTSGQVYNIDKIASTTPSVVGSLRAVASPTNNHIVRYTVTFSERVTGVDPGDFALTADGVSGATVIDVDGREGWYKSDYTVTVHTGNGSGTIRLDLIDNDTIYGYSNLLGGIGAGNGDFTAGEAYVIDKTVMSTMVTKLEDTNDGFCDADCSLREAIAAADIGDTVTFDVALSGQTIHLISTLTFSTDVTVDGAALAVPITISGDANSDGIGDVQAFYNAAGIIVTLNKLRISMGYAGYGGGLYNTGMLTVTNSTFTGNSSEFGGGLYNSGELTVLNSTFSGNSAVSEGGGFYNIGTMAIANSTLSGNIADTGGGYYNGGSLTVTNSTIAGNSAASEGGGIVNHGMLSYANTMVANSLSGEDCVNYGVISLNTKNLVESDSEVYPCSPPLSGDPNLGTLADNGGPTQTMALLTGSPAIDAGDDAVCAAAPINHLDQRGVVRPQDAHCDIGAFELINNVTPVVFAGDDQTIDLINSLTVNASYSDPDQTGNYSATVDWNDGTTGTLTVTTTGSGTGDVTGAHTYSAGGDYIVEICVTDLYGAVGCDTLDVKVIPSPNMVMVATGDRHTCSLSATGGVYCWGLNVSGQLGNGTNSWDTPPVSVTGLGSGVMAIATGTNHTCALTSTGGVKCWGENYKGQLGDGTTTNRNTPVNVSGLTSGVTAITAGNFHTCALLSSGGVKCWGENTHGQLGNGNYTDRTTPVNVTGLTSGVAKISAGEAHTCAVTTSGGAKCWGRNDNGQLGNGTTTGRATPANVSGLASGVMAISAGGSYGGAHTCALTSSGGVKCWGENSSGRLGDGTTTRRTTPVDVVGLTSGVAAVAAGYTHTCALTTSGGVKCWSNNTLIDVPGVASGVVTIDTGGSYSCAVTANGYVKCWGSNISSQLGIGVTDEYSVPVNTRGLNKNAIGIEAGAYHTCALIANGGVKCWGSNTAGQLGDGSTYQRLTPVNVGGLTDGVMAVSSGGDSSFSHTCALTMNGGVKCWGENISGQLGDGATNPSRRTTPVDVSGLTSGVVAISAGANHTCAVMASGGVKCWGGNSSGQLGDGTTTTRRVPVDVSGLTSGVIAISAGGNHTCALTAAGGIKCWGSNASGQLGIGSTIQSLVPVDVNGLTSGIVAISAGVDHTCALTANGGAKCWGENSWGRLGDGTMTDRSLPVDVSGLTGGVTAISAGGTQTCALTTTGGVKCWGFNQMGEVGDGTTSHRTSPVDVSGLTSGVTAISAGGAAWSHSCALLSSGEVKCWGYNDNGQLGNDLGGYIPRAMSVIFNP